MRIKTLDISKLLMVSLLILSVGCGSDDGDGSGPPLLSECETGSNPNVTFTASFTDLDGIAHIEPLGEIQAFHNFSEHTYVFIKSDVT